MTSRTTRDFRELGRARKYRRGSRRRLQRIHFRGNWSREAIIFVLSMLLILTVIVPWLVHHALDEPPEPNERPAFRMVR